MLQRRVVNLKTRYNHTGFARILSKTNRDGTWEVKEGMLIAKPPFRAGGTEIPKL